MLQFLFRARPRFDATDKIVVRPFCKDTDQQKAFDLIARRFEEIGLTLDLEDDDKDLTDIELYWQKIGKDWKNEGVGEFAVLERNGELIGTIAVCPLINEPGVAKFSWYFLEPRHEGKGLGLYLLRWGLYWCLDHGIKKIELWTGEKRWWAHKIYKKIGFEHNGIKKKVRDNPPYHLMLFELPLNDTTVPRLKTIAESFPKIEGV